MIVHEDRPLHEPTGDDLAEVNRGNNLPDANELDVLAVEDIEGGGSKRLHLAGTGFPQLTHYLFRYPAKFHPPVIRTLLEQYTNEGDRILDPFCGSGTLLVEAGVSVRHAIGSDIDPVAVFVSQVKTRRLDISRLSRSCAFLVEELRRLRRSNEEYAERQFKDLTREDVEAIVVAERLWVPAISNLYHWFRRYVVVDLARIYQSIRRLPVPEDHRDFLRLCFASVIRAASNADPVPVSGLEVTAHMKRKDAAGRIINPFALLEKALKRSVSAVVAYQSVARFDVGIEAFTADATRISDHLLSPIDAVITSPPYHNAVDYYRRHQLEMFWLGFTASHADRLALLPRYIGRPQIPQRHPFVVEGRLSTPLACEWEIKMREVSPKRADGFKHYVVAMRKTFDQLAHLLPVDGRALFVVGHSTWNSGQIPTDSLFVELASPAFTLDEQLWYPVVNRYMSYARHNDANIDKEYVLVFRRIPPG